MPAIFLLTIPNVFMPIAWYGHLKHRKAPLGQTILISRGIAFLEYSFRVPANRLGYGQFSAVRLKTIQKSSRWSSSARLPFFT